MRRRKIKLRRLELLDLIFCMEFSNDDTRSTTLKNIFHDVMTSTINARGEFKITCLYVWRELTSNY